MDKRKVVVADMVRTPWGKPGGSLEPLLSSDLSAPLLTSMLARTGVDAECVDQVIFGQAHPSTYPNNIGHYAWLKAELPVDVPGYTVQSNTVSALQAVRNAYYLIASGNEEICIAGGADSYSAAPFVMRDVRNHFYPEHRKVIDTLEEAENFTQPQPTGRLERYTKVYGNGLSLKAQQFQKSGFTRAVEYASSHSEQMVPLSYTVRKRGQIVVSEDEWIKKGETQAELAPYADGAAAVMLMTAERAEELGLTPKAEILGFSVAGDTVSQPAAAGAEAVRKLLKTQKKEMEQISCIEILENSAEEVLQLEELLGKGPAVNPNGGAMSFGLNDGAEGIFMMMRLVDALESGQLGIVCMYSAGGLGMAALLRKE